jgi:hypothetical protein
MRSTTKPSTPNLTQSIALVPSNMFGRDSPLAGITEVKLHGIAEFLFWEWAADDRVGNQHVKFFLARSRLSKLRFDL